MGFLKIIRPVNLLLIALVQCLVKFTVFDHYLEETALSTFQFFLLLASSLLIAAGGNVINDIYDQEIDRINKPDVTIISRLITEKQAYNYYFVLTVLGVIAGFVLANQLGRPAMAGIFVVISALLYIYSSQLKGMLLVGNVLVSAIVAFSLLIVLLFDLYPVISENLLPVHLDVSKLILHYSLFALAVNLIREIVKDIQDVNGDQKGGINSLAIALGRKRAVNISLGMGVLMTAGLVLYMYQNFYGDKLLVVYFLLLVIAPFIYFCISCWSAENQKDYKRMSDILKIIMLTGMCSLPLAAKSLL